MDRCRPVVDVGRSRKRTLKPNEAAVELLAANGNNAPTADGAMSAACVSDSMVNGIAALAGRKGFSFADVLPWFHGASLREVTNSTVDSHLNSAGHAIIASGIERHLVEAGCCDDDEQGIRSRR
jgi:hypothetical protein